MARPATALLALLALAASAAAQSPCAEVPTLSGVDQSATPPSEYGKCTSKTQTTYTSKSHWCAFNKMGSWPAAPSGKARQCLKFGRSTIYRGPIYGSSSAHKAACNRVLRGNDNFAMVAVSTKYLKTFQGGWTKDQGACHKCMCIRMHGGDDLFNKGLQKERVQQRMGLTMLGKVRGAGAWRVPRRVARGCAGVRWSAQGRAQAGAIRPAASCARGSRKQVRRAGHTLPPMASHTHTPHARHPPPHTHTRARAPPGGRPLLRVP
jgi:hypothetical protein